MGDNNKGSNNTNNTIHSKGSGDMFQSQHQMLVKCCACMARAWRMAMQTSTHRHNMTPLLMLSAPAYVGDES
jgi:hypothetical protein